jgi:nitrate/nitrite-specific signal transduction histidine kinase
LTRSGGAVSLIVSDDRDDEESHRRDDGIGFDRSRFGSTAGLGLIMMRERATQLNGEFDVDSAPGQGTTIRVVIPFR